MAGPTGPGFNLPTFAGGKGDFAGTGTFAGNQGDKGFSPIPVPQPPSAIQPNNSSVIVNTPPNVRSAVPQFQPPMPRPDPRGIGSLKLTPQQQALYDHQLNDLRGPGGIKEAQIRYDVHDFMDKDAQQYQRQRNQGVSFPPQPPPPSIGEAARGISQLATGGFNFMGSPRARSMGFDVTPASTKDMVTRQTAVGSITANKYAANDIAGFLNDLHAAGAPLNQFNGVYNPRHIRGGSAWSQHAYGNAVDIESGPGRGPDNSPGLFHWAQKNPQQFQSILDKHHMKNLASHDFGHFEWSPGGGGDQVARRSQQANFGGGTTIAPKGGTPTSYNPIGSAITAIGGAIGSAVDTVAKLTGIPSNFVAAIGAMESSLNPGSNRNSRTQYKGLFQISQNEFREAARHGMAGNGDLYNPHDNAQAMAYLINRNKQQFKARFRRDPTPAELYLLHQQGLGFYTNRKMTNVAGNLPRNAPASARTRSGFEKYWTAQLEKRSQRYAYNKRQDRLNSEFNLPEGL
jgi:hypothetical protein